MWEIEFELEVEFELGVELEVELLLVTVLAMLMVMLMGIAPASGMETQQQPFGSCKRKRTKAICYRFPTTGRQLEAPGTTPAAQSIVWEQDLVRDPDRVRLLRDRQPWEFFLSK